MNSCAAHGTLGTWNLLQLKSEHGERIISNWIKEIFTEFSNIVEEAKKNYSVRANGHSTIMNKLSELEPHLTLFKQFPDSMEASYVAKHLESTKLTLHKWIIMDSVFDFLIDNNEFTTSVSYETRILPNECTIIKKTSDNDSIYTASPILSNEP